MGVTVSSRVRVLSHSNGIAGVGGRALATLLTRECALESLDLDNNAIGDEGAIAMAEALRSNTTLRSYVSLSPSPGCRGVHLACLRVGWQFRACGGGHQ